MRSTSTLSPLPAGDASFASCLVLAPRSIPPRPSLFISVSAHPPDRVVDGIWIYLESRHGCCGRNRFLGQLTRLGSRRLCLDSSSFVRLTRCGCTASTPSRTTPRRRQRRAGSTSSSNLLGSTGLPLFTDRFGHGQVKCSEGGASASRTLLTHCASCRMGIRVGQDAARRSGAAVHAARVDG